MPTSGYNFTNQEITVRFRAPYITESLNQQFRGIVSAGVYEGFDPQISATPMHITLATDASSGRSSALAVSNINTTTSVGVHLTGNVDLDLSAFASKTVAVCIDLSYAFPADTTGVINVYDLGTETVPATSSVLARVVVPAAGLIPAANISIDGRSFPYLSRGRDATPMVSVVRNGGPYLVRSFGAVPDFWDHAPSVSMSFDSSNAVMAPTGFNLSFRARKTVAGAGAITGSIIQKIGLPIPTNRRLRLVLNYRPQTLPTVGVPFAIVTLVDAAGTFLASVTIALDSTVLGVWKSYDVASQLPSLAAINAVIKEVQISVNGVQYTTAGANQTLFYVAGYDAQLEQHGPATDALPEISGESHFTKTRHYTDAFPGAAYSQITFDGATTLLSSSVGSAAHTFEVAGNVLVDQDLTILGSVNFGFVFGNNIDTAPPIDASSLTLGGVNALSVIIGRVGRDTLVNGALLVGTALNPDTAQVHIDGPVTLSTNTIYGRPGTSNTLRFDLPDGGEGYSFSSTANFLELKTPDAPLATMPIIARTDVRYLGQISFDRTGTLVGDSDAILRTGLSNTAGSLQVRSTLTSDYQLSLGREDGVSGGTPAAGTLRGTDRRGTVDSAGAPLILAGGKGTGTGIGGSVSIKTAAAGVSGSTQNPLVDRIVVDSTGLVTISGGLTQAGGSFNLNSGTDSSILASSSGDLTIQALSGDVSVLSTSGDILVSTEGDSQFRSTMTGNVTISTFSGTMEILTNSGDLSLGSLGGDVQVLSIIGGVGLWVGGAPLTLSAGDLLIGNALGSGGVSVFAGGTPPTPGTNELLLGAVSAVKVTAPVVELAKTGDATVNVGGVVRTLRRGSHEVFSIDGCLVERNFQGAISNAGYTFPTVQLPAGRYEFKALIFYERLVDNGQVSLSITPSTGTCSGYALDSKSNDTASPLNQHITVEWSGASAAFTNAPDVNASYTRGCHMIEGVITYSNDTLITVFADWLGANNVTLHPSFVRFFGHQVF